MIVERSKLLSVWIVRPTLYTPVAALVPFGQAVERTATQARRIAEAIAQALDPAYAAGDTSRPSRRCGGTSGIPHRDDATDATLTLRARSRLPRPRLPRRSPAPRRRREPRPRPATKED